MFETVVQHTTRYRDKYMVRGTDRDNGNMLIDWNSDLILNGKSWNVDI